MSQMSFYCRNSSSGARQKISPPSGNSSEVPHKTSPRGVSLAAPPKFSSRIVRQLKPAAQDSHSSISSANLASRRQKERSPKVADRRSLGSPVSEVSHITPPLNVFLSLYLWIPSYHNAVRCFSIKL